MDSETTGIKRGPGRPPMHREPVVIEQEPAVIDTMRNAQRPEVRTEDPREAAARRTAEILSQRGDTLGDEGGGSAFDVPPGLQPDGWTYEWKNFSVLNKEESTYINTYQHNGWSFVPADRPGHHVFLPTNWNQKIILKDGMALVERPTEICEMIKKRTYKFAREQIRVKDDSLKTSLGHGYDDSNKGKSLTKVNRTYVPGPIPD